MPERSSIPIIFSMLLCLTLTSAAAETPGNPLFPEQKIKNYLPHMTWPEVEAALKRTDVAVIPVGSLEQHGPHLPIGTDTIQAVEICKNIAQKADVLIAPIVLAGLSEHHMGFPGTITLSPATFEAVLFETALSLIHHGVRKVAIYNGHGGNSVSVAAVIQRINQETSATAVNLEKISISFRRSPFPAVSYDPHAGVDETSSMLFLAGTLVDMSKAANPVLTFPPAVLLARERILKNSGFRQVYDNTAFRPAATGKKSSSREMSSNGIFTDGDVKTASAARGQWKFELFVEAAAKFLEEWRTMK